MQKYDRYKQLIKKAQDKHGFIESNKCDSLLFTGLVGCVPGVSVDISAAFDPASKTWKRRPIEHSCYPNSIKSSISRDMLVGLAWYCWANDRKDIAEQVVKYALTHWGIMGEAESMKSLIGRCFIGPGLLGTFARIAGPKYWWLHWLPTNLPGAPALTGYRAHLQVLHRLLRCKMSGKDPAKDKMLQKQAARQPQNPLFLAAVGKVDNARAILNNEKYWPASRLPTEQDRKEPWLPQRDFGDDWKPISSNHVHAGGDYLFCEALCRGDV